MSYSKNKAVVLSVIVLTVLFCGNLYSQSGWYQLNSGTDVNLNSVSFINEYTGYMVGDNLGIKTVNGGFNWLVIPGVRGGTSIKFINANTGFVANNTILKTTNGGSTWADANVSYIKDICFVDANTGYGVGEFSTVIKTTNGGGSWVGQFINFSYFTFNSVFFTDAYHGYMVGGRSLPAYTGVIYQTTDGGQTWVYIDLQMQNFEFKSVNFPNSSTGYIVGGDVTSQSGIIFKTTNAGANWLQQGITNRDLNSVFFVNGNTGYAVGADGMVLKTIDGSILWNTELSNTNNDLNSVYFVQPTIGFTAGKSGDIQKTLNGGTQGAPYTLEGMVNYELSGLPVPTGKIAALAFNYSTGQITKVDTATITNGFYRFMHIPGNDSTDIMAYQDDEVCDFVGGFYPGSIFWSNSITLYPRGNLTGINLTVKQTQNPGGPRIVSGGVFTAINGVGLSDARVYARSGNQYFNMGISVNGGHYAVKDLPPGDYEMVCDRMGYRSATRNVHITGTDLDTINFYLTSVGPIGISNQNLYVPSSFAMQQNYPNPFNPSTNIRFDVPKESKVRLSVFDVLGREVEVLVDGQLKPGTYKVDWKADKYSSGLYFYKIVTNDFIDVKKMILVK